MYPRLKNVAQSASTAMRSVIDSMFNTSNKDFSYEISMVNGGHSPPIEGLTAYRVTAAPRIIISNIYSMVKNKKCA